MGSNDTVEKKKLRNRLSQRAFRLRQAEMIRDLRHRADSRNYNVRKEGDYLQAENTKLRQRLICIQSKFTRLISTMQCIYDSTSLSLEESAHSEANAQNESLVPSNSGEPPDAQNCSVELLELEDSAHLTSYQQDINQATNPHAEQSAIVAARQLQLENVQILDEVLSNISPVPNQHDFSLGSPDMPITAQIPNIWSFEYQMGPQTYLNSVSIRKTAGFTDSQIVCETNSPFSDHIQLLHHVLKNRTEQQQTLTEQLNPFFYQQVLTALSLFNSIHRPDVMAWYSKTKFYHIVDLTAWQIYPCPQSYSKLSPQYRPTTAQLQHQYPIVIDWVPFSSIRDQLITRHAANSQIDRVFCDVVSSYVVETQMSHLAADAPATICYIRITDLIANIPPTLLQSGKITPARLPAPDIATLFALPEYSLAVFQFLHMDQMLHYRVDPALFGKYPELYRHDCDITARGILVKPEKQPILSSPKRIDGNTLDTYLNVMHFSLNAPYSNSKQEDRLL